MGQKENIESLQAPVEVTIVAEMPDGRIVRLISKEPKAVAIKVHPLYGKSHSGLILTGVATTEVTGYNIVLRVDGVKILEQETLTPAELDPADERAERLYRDPMDDGPVLFVVPPEDAGPMDGGEDATDHLEQER